VFRKLRSRTAPALAFIALPVLSALAGGASPLHAAADATAFTLWLQTMDSCNHSLGNTEFQITDTASPHQISPVDVTAPASSLKSVGSTSTCPLQRGNCATISYGCVQVTITLAPPDTLQITEIATPPPNSNNPLGFAPCNGGSACRSELATLAIDASGGITATTTNTYPDGTTSIYPAGGTFSASAADPIVFHDFGLGYGSCDGDGDADDHLTGTPSSHCAYQPESAEATACQPYPWSCTATESATHFILSNPGPQLAGTPFNVTITAYDAGNDVADNYAGTEGLSWSGPKKSPSGKSPLYPTSATFTNSVATVSVTLFDAQTTSLAVTQGSITGSITGLTVSPAPAHSLSLTTPSPTAGQPFTERITAKDSYGNVATSYSGASTTTWSGASTSPGGFSPVYPSSVTFSSGIGSGSVTLYDAQTTALSVTAGTLKGKSGTFTVQPATAASFTLTTPVTPSAGAPFSETVTAIDAYGNVATGYSGGALSWSGPSPSPSGVAPSYPANPVTFSGGAATVSVTLVDAQNTSIALSDGSISGVSGALTVVPSGASQLLVSNPGAQTAGTAFAVSVTALDAYGNTATGYAGAPAISGPDAAPGGATPAYSANPLQFSGGVATVTITLFDAETTALSVSDGSIIGTSGAFSVFPGSTADLTVSLPDVSPIGQQVTAAISAFDSWGNVASADSSTLDVATSDGVAAATPGDVPSSVTLSGGQASFGITFFSPGMQSVTVSGEGLQGSASTSVQ
jgi:hypothetical protein